MGFWEEKEEKGEGKRSTRKLSLLPDSGCNVTPHFFSHSYLP